MQRYIFRHRMFLKKITLNVTVLATVFKSDDKFDDSIFKNTVSYSIMRFGTVRYGDASEINSIEILYKYLTVKVMIMSRYRFRANVTQHYAT